MDAIAKPKGCTSFKLRQLSRVVARHYDAHVAASGLKTSQFSLLSNIMVDGPVRPVDLAARMNLDASTLTRNLKPLIAEGWVEMGEGADARSRLVHITPTGRAKRDEARALWQQAQRSLNERLGLVRVAQLHALIDEALDVLAPGEADDPAC
ncbi:MAG: winged helix-turn-helix transcriptional regulator [Variovorax sp.]|nr:winged helix-turn-helix transcriptional regulator [Variovorax sp.]